MMADPLAARFIGGVAERAVVWRQLCAMAGAWSIAGCSMFSVVEKSTGRWIGRLGPWTPADWPGTEVGWALAREAWGKGLATEGAAAAMDYAVDVLGWSEIIHCVDPENLASAAVARRLGSTSLRTHRFQAPFNVEVDVWGQPAEAWRARRRQRCARSELA